MIGSIRSLLFVPGNRAERFGKALAAGADAVCIDLEDAVPNTAKAEARATVMAFLRRRADEQPDTAAPILALRINAIRTQDGLRDLAALADALAAAARPDFLMVPKFAHPTEAAILAEAFSSLPLWPIIESAAGLRHAADIAAGPNIAGLLFGAVDYAAEAGCTLDWEPLAYARGALAAARAAAGIQLLDVPHLDIGNLADLDQATRRAKACGFTGRACIHPAQIATVNAAFTPSEAEIHHATRLIDALEQAGGNAASPHSASWPGGTTRSHVVFEKKQQKTFRYPDARGPGGSGRGSGQSPIRLE